MLQQQKIAQIIQKEKKEGNYTKEEKEEICEEKKLNRQKNVNQQRINNQIMNKRPIYLNKRNEILITVDFTSRKCVYLYRKSYKLIQKYPSNVSKYTLMNKNHLCATNKQ